MSIPKSDPKLIALAARDPVIFISYYSGLNLKDFQCDMLYAIEKHDRIIVLLPAQHGKSTLVSLWWLVYKVAQNRNVRIILLMKSDDELKTYARSIRAILSHNMQLNADFGRFAPQGKDAVWSNDSIIVAGRQIHDPQPTILFSSAATIDQALGRRCDIFIADDIVTPTTVSTESQRDKQWSLFNEGIETSPQYVWDRDPKTGRLLVPEGINWPQDIQYEKGVVCGTVFHPDDLYHRKIGKVAEMPHGKLLTKLKDPMYVALKYDCWTDEAKTLPLWPERRTPEWLRLKEKSVGTIEFERRYRNIAVNEGAMVFKKLWVRGGGDGAVNYPGCLDETRVMGEVPECVNHIVMGLDPSTGRKGRGTTFTAAVVIGVDTRKNPMKRYLIDVYRAQLGFDDIVSLITFGDDARGIPGLYKLYRYSQARIESNAAQSYLLNNARMREAELKGVRVLPHETQHANKSDKLVGVASMQAMFKDGLFSIPYADEPTTIEKAEGFIDEILLFPEGVHDYAMALWFAELAVRKQGSEFKCINAGPGQVFQNPRYR